jgi:cobalt-zinc-cadmium efflux system outer membrane protein
MRGRLSHSLKHERMNQIDSRVFILFVVSLNQILATGLAFRERSPCCSSIHGLRADASRLRSFVSAAGSNSAKEIGRMKPIRMMLFRAGFVAVLVIATQYCAAQQALTWEQVKAKFESANPALKADALNVDEMHAAEVTAFLRPNPQFTASTDGTQIVPHNGVWQPLAGTDAVATFSYLHERDHKRELRLESAKEGAQIAESQHEDLKRTLEFNLRAAFVNTLQAKAILDLAKADLDYYDHIIQISRDRFKAGDIAQIDLDRIELLRVQYETEIQTAIVNLRTAKIQLLQLLNDRTAVEQFDLTGPFDFSDALKPLDDIRQTALDARPDLEAALQTIQQSETNHKLAISNGSTDPTYSGWYTYNSSNNNPNGIQTLGASVNIPLRIFDRNQGEKQRTLIDIGRSQQASQAVRAQVFGDVDSAYAQVESNIALLKPYKAQYRDQATRVRDTVTYSYQHGGASLMDFLNAQSEYRTVQEAYLQLIGSYLTAAAQLNLAVGREVIQ